MWLDMDDCSARVWLAYCLVGKCFNKRMWNMEGGVLGNTCPMVFLYISLIEFSHCISTL